MGASRSALIVATAAYEDPKLPDLDGPTRDAEELRRVLGDPKIGGFDVEILENPRVHELRKRLERFFTGQRVRDDILLLHLSCHGLKDDPGRLYFAATDTELGHLFSTGVSDSWLRELIDESRSQQIVLLLDCCFGGAFADSLTRRAAGAEAMGIEERFQGRGRVVLTASTAMQYAFEGGKLDGAPETSVFTSAIVDGLESGAADSDGDGWVSIDELYDYTVRQIRDSGARQTPTKSGYVESDILLARAARTRTKAKHPAHAGSLPRDLRTAIASRSMFTRLGAISELLRVLTHEPGQKDSAMAALRLLAEDDSRRVSATAHQALIDAARSKNTQSAQLDIGDRAASATDPLATAASVASPAISPTDTAEPVFPVYDQFELHFSRSATPSSYRVEAKAQDGTRATGSFLTPFTDLEFENFLLKVGQPRRQARAVASPEMALAMTFGGRLYDALFNGAVLESYNTARQRAEHADHGLRLELGLASAPELMDIPWEFLYNRPQFVATSIYTPVVRSIDVGRASPVEELRPPVNVLAIVGPAGPYGLLDAATERRALEHTLAPAGNDGLVRLTWLERPTLRNLEDALALPQKTHVVHFIGHGGTDPHGGGGLLLEDDRGRQQLVSTRALAVLLRDHRSLRLAVFQTDEGARSSVNDPFAQIASDLIKAQLPAAVWMQFEMTDRANVIFSERLYTALAGGYPVDTAVALTRRALFAAGSDIEALTPALLVRGTGAPVAEVS